jgi:hypothetical protein
MLASAFPDRARFLVLAVLWAGLWACEVGPTSAVAVDAGEDGAIDASTTSDASDAAAPVTDFARLSALSGKRIYFQHASVGGEAMGVYQAIGAWPAPTWGLIKIVADQPGSGTSVATDVHAAGAIGVGRVGEWSHGAYNGDPTTKLALFDQYIRGGLGGAMDIVVFKLGTPDIDQENGTVSGTGGVSQATWFSTVYKPTMDALEAKYPGTLFVHATLPINNCDAYWGNVHYEQWNQRIRHSYAGRVFDLAYWESVNAAGQRTYDPDGAPCIHPDWAIFSDAHVNEPGADWLGEHLLAVLASLP